MKNACCWVLATLLVIFMLNAGCKKKEAPQVIKEYPIDSVEGILSQTSVIFDSRTSADSRGSLRIDASSGMVVRLFEIDDPQVENAKLIYRAKLKTQDLDGKVFIEMRCEFPGKGEFTSRALESYATGTTDWVTQETPFFLKKGQKPSRVKLNLYITGKGTVWVDDVKVIKAPRR
ncbi:MAG: hypothetical protein ACYDHW_14280 [Syntrophorhabdaceae bacterium]